MSLDGRRCQRLYLLIEESDREFDSRCLIAAVAARRDMEVIIGSQWAIWERLESLPTGVILFKGNNRVQATNMHRAKRAGHLVASIEEEVLGLADETEIRHHYAEGIHDCCDLFLVQGRFQATCLERHFPDAADRIKIAGNPRVDLLREPFRAALQAQAAELREQHGEFVLLNTNFGGINPAHGDSLTFYNRNLQVGMVDPSRTDERVYFQDRMRWERDNARMLIAFAWTLHITRPDIKIILRPHPAERMERWHRFLGPNSPAVIIREGGHLPWTLASAVMVHTGCTTGLEAALLKKPALSLVPGENPWHGSAVSNVANPTARTIDEALARVIAQLDGETPTLLDEMRVLDFSRYIDDCDGALSADRVTDALQELAAGIADIDEQAFVEQDFRHEPRLLDWQAQKYTVTLDQARRSVATITGNFPHGPNLEVDTVAGGAIRIRAL
jgi:surface carbohydrate biosynthesis protein